MALITELLAAYQREDKQLEQLPSYAFPGGYPIFYVDSQNSCLCPKCANNSFFDPDEIESFKPIAYDINYEILMYCDQCSEQIESAYDVIDDTEE